MTDLYDNAFFDWVDATARRSAGVVVPLVAAATGARSVADVGCGRGIWLAAWQAHGITDIVGFDGDYVDRSRLAIDPTLFRPTDLTRAWSGGRRFDLAQSLEVAEHLPASVGPAFVSQLCALADIVVFSAAQPGQGGENHINERHPSYWAGLFATHGFAPYDCIRPQVRSDATVDPWYRFNTIIYANAAGAARLSSAARATKVDTLEDLDGGGSLAWRARALILRPLPVPMVTALSRLRYRIASRFMRAGMPS